MVGTDRRITLALQAFVAGALDFSQSYRYSRVWIIKRELVLDRLETDNLVRLKAMKHLQHAAAAAFGDGEMYKHHFDTSAAELKGVGELLFPWIDWKSDAKAGEYRELWESFFGIKVGSKEWEALEHRAKMLDKFYTADKSRDTGIVQ